MYKGYDYFYVNGSSHTKGGGFETAKEDGCWHEELKQYYASFYDVQEWESCNDINWGTRLSQIINIPCVNEAIQGGGLDRAVRKTYRFIQSNFRPDNKFFIILEIPDSSRIDVYYKPWDEFFVVTGGDGTAIGQPPGDVFYAASPTYFPKVPGVEKLQDDFKFYYDNFYKSSVHFEKNETLLNGLYSYCKRLGIPIKILNGYDRSHKFLYDETDVVSYHSRDLDLYNWCAKYEKLIKHETKGYVMDGHPGYFGHIEYAKLMKNWLDENLEELSETYGHRGFIT